jgi:hypothetical protein
LFWFGILVRERERKELKGRRIEEETRNVRRKSAFSTAEGTYKLTCMLTEYFYLFIYL